MLEMFDRDDADSLDYILMSKPSMLDKLEKYSQINSALSSFDEMLGGGSDDEITPLQLEPPMQLPTLELLQSFKQKNKPINTLAIAKQSINNTAKTIGNLLNRTTPLQQTNNVDKKNSVLKYNKNVKSNIGIINEAKKMLNKPYIWGASPKSNKGADCSSLVSKAVKNAKGINIPRTAQAQWFSNIGKRKSLKDANPGDAIYFNFPNKRGVEVSHVGICLDKGCNTIIDASHGAGRVRIKRLTQYYKKHAVGVKEF